MYIYIYTNIYVNLEYEYAYEDACNVIENIVIDTKVTH